MRYSSLFKISLIQELTYKTSFIVWMIRNLISILLLYFLWDSIFSSNTSVFGYNKASIISYILGVFVIRSIVVSVKSNEVAGEIARGDLSNYLLKPLNYFRYWFTRDLAIKLINLVLIILEIAIILVFLHPVLAITSSIPLIIIFLLAVICSVFLYFFVLMVFSLLTFWFSEQAWGLQFLLIIFTDLLGGGIFPLDILPVNIQNIINLTPFPYIFYKPLQIILGRLSIAEAITTVLFSGIWILILYAILQIELK